MSKPTPFHRWRKCRICGQRLNMHQSQRQPARHAAQHHQSFMNFVSQQLHGTSWLNLGPLSVDAMMQAAIDSGRLDELILLHAMREVSA